LRSRLENLYRVVSHSSPLRQLVVRMNIHDVDLERALEALKWEVSIDDIYTASLTLAILSYLVSTVLMAILLGLIISAMFSTIVSYFVFKLLYYEPLRIYKVMTLRRIRRLIPILNFALKRFSSEKVPLHKLIEMISYAEEELSYLIKDCRLGTPPLYALLRSLKTVDGAHRRVIEILYHAEADNPRSLYGLRSVASYLSRSLNAALMERVHAIESLTLVFMSISFFIPLLVGLVYFFYRPPSVVIVLSLLIYITLLTAISKALVKEL